MSIIIPFAASSQKVHKVCNCEFVCVCVRRWLFVYEFEKFQSKTRFAFSFLRRRRRSRGCCLIVAQQKKGNYLLLPVALVLVDYD